MTTVVFYKGVMGADTLMTEFKESSKDQEPEDVEGFDLVDFKIQFRKVDGKDHLFGAAGCVDNINDFFTHYSSLKKFRPDHKFSILEWDGEELILYETHNRMLIPILLELLSFGYYEHPLDLRVKKKVLNWKDRKNFYVTLGSGAEYAIAAYEKMKFQMGRQDELIQDHLTPEEVITYMIKTAALCDVFTNDKLFYASFNKPDESKYTSVSPQLAKLSKE